METLDKINVNTPSRMFTFKPHFQQKVLYGYIASNLYKILRQHERITLQLHQQNIFAKKTRREWFIRGYNSTIYAIVYRTVYLCEHIII